MEYEQQTKLRSLEEIIGDSSATIVEEIRGVLSLRVQDYYLLQYMADASSEVLDVHRATLIARIEQDIARYHEQLNKWNLDHFENTIPGMRKRFANGELREDLPKPEVSRASIVKCDKLPPTTRELEHIFDTLVVEQRHEMLERVERCLSEQIDIMRHADTMSGSDVDQIDYLQQRLDDVRVTMLHDQVDREIQDSFVPEFDPSAQEVLHTHIGTKLGHVAAHIVDTGKHALSAVRYHND